MSTYLVSHTSGRRCSGAVLRARERLAPHTYCHIPVAVDAAAVLRARERLAPVAVIGTDEGTDDDG